MNGDQEAGVALSRIAAAVTSSATEQNVRKPRPGISRVLKFLGPAFVVSVAYMDPGNFGTNITAGSNFNYGLVWVILWSNIFAIFLQTLSAKLGIASGVDLPAHCRNLFSKGTNVFLWTVAVVASWATNLAEFLGGSLGFYLLFGIPPVFGAALTGVFCCIVLESGKHGQGRVEGAISGLVSVISLAYVVELFLAKPDWGQIAVHTVVPSLNVDSLFVAVGMLGATVMPHVIFLHSHLVQSRRNATPEAMREHLFMEKVDVAVAMNVAFVINAAMVVVSASTFFSRGVAVDSIEVAHQTLQPLLGRLSSVAFGVALLASGLSSSTVGTYAGQVIMEGFVRVKVPVRLERVITMIPAIAIIGLGLNPVRVLVTSQVVLSFALPAAIIPLLLVTARKDIMGEFANGRSTKIVGWAICSLIVILNLALLYTTLLG